MASKSAHATPLVRLLIGAACCCPPAVGAGGVALPHTFAENTPARAAEVNANFAAVAAAAFDNETRVAGLEAQVLALQGQVASLLAQLNALQASPVLALEPYVAVIDVPDPYLASVLYPTVQFSGVNLRVVNGTGSTESANGLGNLIVGYNAHRDPTRVTCSLPAHSDEAACTASGGAWRQDHRSGSHNLVVGDENAYSSHGALLAGWGNTANGDFATVTGGSGNLASGLYSSAAGGLLNTAGGRNAAVVGGQFNAALGRESSILGGSSNLASGESASIGGGNGNRASGYQAAVAGGQANVASGTASSVSGGGGNVASAERATVGGGNARTADGPGDWRAGSLLEDQ